MLVLNCLKLLFRSTSSNSVYDFDLTLLLSVINIVTNTIIIDNSKYASAKINYYMKQKENYKSNFNKSYNWQASLKI